MIQTNDKQEKIRKIAVTVPAAILLLALYMIIFGFSAQDAEQSGSLSLRISESAVRFLNAFVGGGWSQAFKEDLALYFEHPIRKLAHFSEYACMGILVYLVWSPWVRQRKKLYWLVVLWVFVSGAFDEFHQLFVPGRYCSFADVCLDTAGGAFGLLMCLTARRIRTRRRRKFTATKSADEVKSAGSGHADDESLPDQDRVH